MVKKECWAPAQFAGSVGEWWLLAVLAGSVGE